MEPCFGRISSETFSTLSWHVHMHRLLSQDSNVRHNTCCCFIESTNCRTVESSFAYVGRSTCYLPRYHNVAIVCWRAASTVYVKYTPVAPIKTLQSWLLHPSGGEGSPLSLIYLFIVDDTNSVDHASWSVIKSPPPPPSTLSLSLSPSQPRMKILNKFTITMKILLLYMDRLHTWGVRSREPESGSL